MLTASLRFLRGSKRNEKTAIIGRVVAPQVNPHHRPRGLSQQTAEGKTLARRSNRNNCIRPVIFPFLRVLVCLLFYTCVVFASINYDSPTVSKVEPPSWWASHTINPVRLLVRGKNLFGAHIR